MGVFSTYLKHGGRNKPQLYLQKANYTVWILVRSIRGNVHNANRVLCRWGWCILYRMLLGLLRISYCKRSGGSRLSHTRGTHTRKGIDLNRHGSPWCQRSLNSNQLLLLPCPQHLERTLRCMEAQKGIHPLWHSRIHLGIQKGQRKHIVSVFQKIHYFDDLIKDALLSCRLFVTL